MHTADDAFGRGGRVAGVRVVSLGASLCRDGRDGVGPAGRGVGRDGAEPGDGAGSVGREGRGWGPAGTGTGFWAWAGINGDSGKLSLYDSSHLTAVVPAGKLEPEQLNFTHTQYQARDCSWHVR